MEQYKKDIISQNKEFQDIIYPLITNDTVQQMKISNSITKQPVLNIAIQQRYHCYCICKS